jgi:hypothetical protein
MRHGYRTHCELVSSIVRQGRPSTRGRNLGLPCSGMLRPPARLPVSTELRAIPPQSMHDQGWSWRKCDDTSTQAAAAEREFANIKDAKLMVSPGIDPHWNGAARFDKPKPLVEANGVAVRVSII